MRMIAAVAIAIATTLGAGCKPATEEDKYRRALGWTDVEDVRRHLDAGMDPNHVFPDGARPLLIVADSMHGDAGTVRLLGERGAQLDVRDGDGKNAWELRWGDPKRPLGVDDAAVLVALVEIGFKPPQEPVDGGRTLLHEVARRAPSARLASLLVTEQGFDVNAPDDNGWTPLHVALHEDNAEAATGLLEQGAEPNYETTKTIGKSSTRGETEIVDWRYEAGSRPLDVWRRRGSARNHRDSREIAEQYGCTRNPAVKNTSR